MTNTERLSGLIPALKRIGGRIARYAPGVAVAAYAVVLTMARPAAAQGLCSIPGAGGPLSLGFGILASIIGAVAIFKFGGGFVKAITGGGRGNAKLRIAMVLAAVGLFLAVGLDSIVPWIMRQFGGGPGSVDLACMVGGGNSSSSVLLLAGVPGPIANRLRRLVSREQEGDD